ncbi:hypothetical protein L6273_00610 [Candidatus Parcubacteria bacterium]|nr:hypothetical protein [Candidatus Parcubacteria bacterium]
MFNDNHNAFPNDNLRHAKRSLKESVVFLCDIIPVMELPEGWKLGYNDRIGMVLEKEFEGKLVSVQAGNSFMGNPYPFGQTLITIFLHESLERGKGELVPIGIGFDKDDDDLNNLWVLPDVLQAVDYYFKSRENPDGGVGWFKVLYDAADYYTLDEIRMVDGVFEISDIDIETDLALEDLTEEPLPEIMSPPEVDEEE